MENTKKEEAKACECCPAGCTCGDCVCCKKDANCGTWCCGSNANCATAWACPCCSRFRACCWLCKLWKVLFGLLVIAALWHIAFGGGMRNHMRWGMMWDCGCGWEMMSWSAVGGQMNCMWMKGMKWERKWWFNRGKKGDKDDMMLSGTVVSGNAQ